VGLIRLPVSERDVVVRQPTGEEDVLLLEATAYDIHLALALVARLARPADGSQPDWETLSVTDLDALLLRIRQAVLGDRIRTDLFCQEPGCGARFDISFRIGDYLDHHRPRRPRGVEPADAPGYYRFRDAPVLFRLPTGQDLAEISRQRRKEQTLIQRCVPVAELSGRMRRRIETALEALAPSLCHNLDAQCPECGATVAIHFDPQRFCLLELRYHAVFLYETVHTLARCYHWSEAEILALPRARRIYYAELARQERSLA